MSIKQTLDSYVGLDLTSGLSEADLLEFERAQPGKLSQDVAELLRHTTGLRTSVVNAIDFTGRSFSFDFRDLVPHGLPIAKTNDGNYWVLDVNPAGAWGPVFYFSHDPPVMVKQFDSLELFITAVASARRVADEAASLVYEVWRDICSGVSAEDARGSKDVLIATFARTLPDNFRIFDLRRKELQGFAWGRGRADLDSRRCGTELVFAVEVAKPRQNLITRLLGG